jgi:hypothetical protein
MNYTKPEITSLASASFVIQATEKAFVPNYVDSLMQVDLKTISAYESDE